MIYIAQKQYDKKPTDYKSIFENLQELESCKHLVGKRTLLANVNGVTTLLIEGASLEIVENFKQDLKTKSGTVLKYLFTDDWCRPIYSLKLPSGKKIKAVFLDGNDKPMFSITDEGEPNCPLMEDFQVRVII